LLYGSLIVLLVLLFVPKSYYESSSMTSGSSIVTSGSSIVTSGSSIVTSGSSRTKTSSSYEDEEMKFYENPRFYGILIAFCFIIAIMYGMYSAARR
jgi:hypothetical protein